MHDLKSLEGGVILALIPGFFPKLEEYRLHKVEPYGIWVESQKYTDTILATASVVSAQRTFVAFVPWSGVTVITSTLEVTSLSETAFGLQ
jgi:hypothetical protein